MEIPRFLHYPSSKWSMTDWIVSHMPFGGSVDLVVESECREIEFRRKATFFNKVAP
ncbi:hypothetical protein B857_01287 [Solibacillus isronensis B3W22]|uniref:Uncharacterized protein n=1 Tax=Solibacillus isronensis B3W22 TaxID=1224748 RepID=K1KPE5_9BACL|nr:hypothetical protein B857_01287 [Solibacillus isronensis B3W22]